MPAHLARHFRAKGKVGRPKGSIKRKVGRPKTRVVAGRSAIGDGTANQSTEPGS